eukprot:g6550.t1
MAYTKCYLRSTPNSFNESAHKLFASFVQTVHRTGFDCSQIVIGKLAGATGTWGEDCGFKTPRLGQTVNIYKSNDLIHWELVADALKNGPKWLFEDSIIFRPAIVYNKQSKKYVLWLNRLPRLDNQLVVKSYEIAGFVVGTSDAPEGPFQFEPNEENAMVQMEHAGGADFAILQDDDDNGKTNRAYILYGAWHHYGMKKSDWRFQFYPDWAKNGHQIAIQELDPESFTRPIGPSTRVTKNGQESPRFITNLNNLLPSKDHIKAQSSGIVTVREYDGTYKYIWTGDMWFSSKSGYKGDDFQYFQPLQFKAEGANSDGIDIPYRSPLWEDCFELRLKTNLQRMHNGGNSYVNTYCNDISGSKQTSQNSMATDHAGSKNDL